MLGEWSLPEFAAGCGGQPAGHQADHGPLDPGFGVLGKAFVVPCQTAVRGQSGQGALHNHPNAGTARRSRVALHRFAHDVHDDAQQSAVEGDQPSGVAAVCEDQCEGEHRHLRTVQHSGTAIAIPRAGGGDQDHHQ